MDQTLQALREGLALYRGSANMNRQQRYDAVVSLAEWKLFSVQHLAQLSGLSKPTIYSWIPKENWGLGGSFNPLSLDTLIQIRENANNSLPVSDMLIGIALDSGNSQLVVSRFTGLSQSTISRRKHDTSSGVQ